MENWEKNDPYAAQLQAAPAAAAWSIAGDCQHRFFKKNDISKPSAK